MDLQRELFACRERLRQLCDAVIVRHDELIVAEAHAAHLLPLRIPEHQEKPEGGFARLHLPLQHEIAGKRLQSNQFAGSIEDTRIFRSNTAKRQTHCRQGKKFFHCTLFPDCLIYFPESRKS